MEHQSIAHHPVADRLTLLWRGVLLALLALISYLALTPAPPPYLPENDKLNHVMAFYALSLALDFSFPERRLGVSKVGALLTYGVLIESIQYLAPNRVFEALDILAGAVGIATYALSLPVIGRLPILRRRGRSSG